MNYLAFEQLCKEKGTTPTALSLKLGLSKGNTTSWKKGGNPSVEILMQLSDELNCTTDYLLGLDNVPNRKKQSPELSEDTQRLIEMYTKLNDMEKGEILGELKTLTKDKFITVSTAARSDGKPSTKNISQSEIEDFKNAKPQKY